MSQASMFPDVPKGVNPDQVQPGTRWRHHKGRYYRVLMLTNEHSEDPLRFPLTVIYMDEQQRTWARPMTQFIYKFAPATR